MIEEPNTSAGEVHRESDPVLNPDEDLRVTHPEWFSSLDDDDEDEETVTPRLPRVVPATAPPAELGDADRRPQAMTSLYVFWARQFIYNNRDFWPTNKNCVYIGHRDGKDWLLDEEHDIWLPVDEDLFRERWFEFFERIRYHKADFPGYWPEEWTPALINSILDHARFLRHLPADVAAVVTERELVSFTDLVPAARWLARLGGTPLLPAQALGMFYGRRSSYKSFAAVELSAAIATGQRNLHGIELDYPEGSWVLYLGAEDALGLQRRLKVACERRNPAVTPRYRLLKGRPVISDAAAVQELIRDLKRAIPAGAPVALVVIDTYNLSRGAGEDENSADSAGRYVDGMKLLGRAFQDAAVIAVHHENRQGTERGSLAFGDNVDFVYRFEREGGSWETTVTCKKQKSGPEHAPFRMKFAQADDGAVLADIEVGAAVRTPSAKERDALFDHEQKALVFRALAKAGPAGLTYGEWKKAASSAGTFTTAKAMMEDREFVVRGPHDERYRLTVSGRGQAAVHGWLKSEIV